MKRRDALAFLGLVGASSAALATENMVSSDKGIAVGNDWNPKKVATALRRLADGIEKNTIFIHRLNLSSDLKPADIITQVLTVEFNLPSSYET